MSLVAYACEVTDISVFHDGRFDLPVNMLVIDATALPEWGRDDYLNYVGMIEGEAEGSLYNDIVDYYSARSGPRERNSLVRGSNFMRAFGFYPSESIA